MLAVGLGEFPANFATIGIDNREPVGISGGK